MEKQVANEKTRRRDRIEIGEEEQESTKERERAYREYEDFAASLNQISDRDIEQALVERHTR